MSNPVKQIKESRLQIRMAPADVEGLAAWMVEQNFNPRRDTSRFIRSLIRGRNKAISLGSPLRTGAATQNGQEVVLGTAMMLVGENSQQVSKRVSDKLVDVNRSLPEGVAGPVSNGSPQKIQKRYLML